MSDATYAFLGGAAFSALFCFGLWFLPKVDRFLGIQPKQWRWNQPRSESAP